MKSKAGRKPIGDKALTDVQKTQAHRQRLKERKQLLDDKGLIEVSLIVTKDQVSKIKAVAKMTKVSYSGLLHAITQPAIEDLCKRHDDFYIRWYEEKEKQRQEWINNNPELFKELLNSEIK